MLQPSTMVKNRFGGNEVLGKASASLIFDILSSRFPGSPSRSCWIGSQDYKNEDRERNRAGRFGDHLRTGNRWCHRRIWDLPGKGIKKEERWWLGYLGGRKHLYRGCQRKGNPGDLGTVRGGELGQELVSEEARRIFSRENGRQIQIQLKACDRRGGWGGSPRSF